MLIAVTLTGASALESHDPFCGSCHTQPEVEYLARSQAEPTDLASAHPIRCIDCHSGAGPLGRTVSLRQGATDLAAYVSGDYARPAMTTNPLGDVACIKCHTQPSGLADLSAPVIGISSSHYHFFEYTDEWLAREPDPHGTCAACHASHTIDGSQAQGWRNAAAESAACEACHEALSGWIPGEA